MNRLACLVVKTQTETSCYLLAIVLKQRSFWVYVATALAGAVLFSLQLVRSLSLPKLRANAKKIMSRLLSSGGIQPSVVRIELYAFR